MLVAMATNTLNRIFLSLRSVYLIKGNLKSSMTTSSYLEYDLINAVCWDLRVKVF